MVLQQTIGVDSKEDVLNAVSEMLGRLDIFANFTAVSHPLLTLTEDGQQGYGTRWLC